MATTNSANDRRIDYVEFNVVDVARAKKFYGEVFGWSFKDYGPGYCEFADSRLTGGFAAGEARGPGGPLVIVYANDLEGIQRRIEAAGGRIVKPAYDFPGGRRFHSSIPTVTSWRSGRPDKSSPLPLSPPILASLGFAGESLISSTVNEHHDATGVEGRPQQLFAARVHDEDDDRVDDWWPARSGSAKSGEARRAPLGRRRTVKRR